jgi:hypothetical protein
MRYMPSERLRSAKTGDESPHGAQPKLSVSMSDIDARRVTCQRLAAPGLLLQPGHTGTQAGFQGPCVIIAAPVARTSP